MANLHPPVVSVIIPCYNGEETIERAIDSVRSQNLRELECIIVDDGSTDGSKEIIEAAISGDPRFSYVYQHNAGVANARNRGVFSSSGEYVCCLDKDDSIHPAFLQVCVEALKSDPSLGIAYTGLYYTKPSGEEGLSDWPGGWDYNLQLSGRNQVPTCNVARREVWNRLGGQRQRYAPSGAGEEDAEMWLRAGAYGWKAGKVSDDGLFLYSWMSGQVSGNREHQVTDYRAWHPWTKDDVHPFASYASPTNRFSHPVHQYDQPVVSVIIPVGPGHEKNLFNALDSLEAQAFREWEAIVIWDCYEGEKPEIVKRIEYAYPYATYVHSGYETGAGRARNLGVKHAVAPLLLFLDADDFLLPGASLLKMVIAFNDEGGRAAIFSDYEGHTTGASEEHATSLKNKDRLKLYDGDLLVFAGRALEYDCERIQRGIENPPFIWNLISTLIPASWHEEVGGFDEAMPSWEDYDYFVRLAFLGKCFVRLPEECLVYSYHTGSRRERGYEIGGKLLHYLEEKYKEIERMPCTGGCGSRRKVVNYSAPAQPLPSQQEIKMPSYQDWVKVKYTHPNKGNHPVYGMTVFTAPPFVPKELRYEVRAHQGGFRLFYQYHSGGDVMIVHKSDAEISQFLSPIENVVRTGPISLPKPPRGPLHAPPVPTAITDILGPDAEKSSWEAERTLADPEPKEVIEKLKAPLDKKQEISYSSVIARRDLQTLPGISSKIAGQLIKSGVTSAGDILELGVDGLTKYDGIGPVRAELVISAVKSQIAQEKPQE